MANLSTGCSTTTTSVCISRSATCMWALYATYILIWHFMTTRVLLILALFFFVFEFQFQPIRCPCEWPYYIVAIFFFLWNKNKWQSSVPRTTWIVDQHSRSARAPCMQLFSLPPKGASSCLLVPIYLASCAPVLPVDPVKERLNKFFF